MKDNLVKNLFSGLFALCLLAPITGHATPHPEKESETADMPPKPFQELKFNTMIYPYMANGHTYFLDELFNPLFDELRNRSKGTLVPHYYVWNELTPTAEIYDSVISGKADMGFYLIDDQLADRFPVTNLLRMPRVDQFSYKPAEVKWEMLQQWPEMQQEWKEVKVMFLYGENNGGIATTSKPIRTVDDMKGMKILCLTELVAKQVEKLEAIPVLENRSIEHMVNLLKTGAVEGMVYDLPGFMIDYGFIEYLKYTVDLRFSPAALYTVMNRSVWDSLTEEQQAAVNTVFDKDAYILADSAMKKMDANYNRRLEEEFGVTRYSMSKSEKSKAAELVQPVRDDYAKTLDSRGFDGKELMQRFDRLYEEFAE